jgi:hypothetical protein
MLYEKSLERQINFDLRHHYGISWQFVQHIIKNPDLLKYTANNLVALAAFPLMFFWGAAFFLLVVTAINSLRIHKQGIRNPLVSYRNRRCRHIIQRDIFKDYFSILVRRDSGSGWIGIPAFLGAALMVSLVAHDVGVSYLISNEIVLSSEIEEVTKMEEQFTERISVESIMATVHDLRQDRRLWGIFLSYYLSLVLLFLTLSPFFMQFEKIVNLKRYALSSLITHIENSVYESRRNG